jgi:hypothetical protein
MCVTNVTIPISFHKIFLCNVPLKYIYLYLLSVVHVLGSHKGRDPDDSRVDSRANNNDKRCCGDGVAVKFHSAFRL